jgi:hypothetical protein
MLGIYNILSQRYKLRPEHSVLVIYDERKKAIAKGFIDIGRRIGARVRGIQLGKKRFEDGRMMGEIFSAIRKGCYDFFINIIDAKVEETDHRIRLTKLEGDAGGRIGHAPGITRSMVDVVVDYRELGEKARKLGKILDGADRVTIKSRLGTALEIFIKDRKFMNDVGIDSRMSNIPCGEIWCAPVEHRGGGIMISDGSVGSLGLLPQPLVVKIKEGKAVHVEWLRRKGRNRRLMKKILEAMSIDEGAGCIGEFGIGLAPFDITGNMLQDEKAAGTIHIAFGANDFFGGKIKSKTHLDFLVRRPTVTAHYTSGKKPRKFMEKGKLLL